MHLQVLQNFLYLKVHLNNRDVLQLLLLHDKRSLYSGVFQGIYSTV